MFTIKEKNTRKTQNVDSCSSGLPTLALFQVVSEALGGYLNRPKHGGKQSITPPYRGWRRSGIVGSGRTGIVFTLILNFLPERKEKSKDEQKEKPAVWITSMFIFFVNILFPAHKHEEILKEKIREDRLRQAAMAPQRKLENDELEAR